MTALTICQTQSPPAELLLENAILFREVVDDVQMLFIHPSGRASQIVDGVVALLNAIEAPAAATTGKGPGSSAAGGVS
jgi:hypothetical protein